MSIVSIYNMSGELIHEIEIPNHIPKHREFKYTIEKLTYMDKSLYNANLYNASLSGVEIVDAKLYRANLKKSTLDRADLSDSDLREVNLQGASMRGTQLVRADLAGANLIEADLIGANFNDSNLFGAIIAERVTLLHKGYLTIFNVDTVENTLEIFNTNKGLYFRYNRILKISKSEDHFNFDYPDTLCSEEEFRDIIKSLKYAKIFKLHIEAAKL